MFGDQLPRKDIRRWAFPRDELLERNRTDAVTLSQEGVTFSQQHPNSDPIEESPEATQEPLPLEVFEAGDLKAPKPSIQRGPARFPRRDDLRPDTLARHESGKPLFRLAAV